jgi:hypothetical protein
MVMQHACQICTVLKPHGFNAQRPFGNPLKKLCRACQLRFNCKHDPLKNDEGGILRCLSGLLGTYGYAVIFFLSIWIVQVSLNRVQVPTPAKFQAGKKTEKPVMNAMLR